MKSSLTIFALILALSFGACQTTPTTPTPDGGNSEGSSENTRYSEPDTIPEIDGTKPSEGMPETKVEDTPEKVAERASENGPDVDNVDVQENPAHPAENNIQDAPSLPEVACTSGTKQPCYDGPTTQVGRGECREGTRLCHEGRWGACEGQINAKPESCDGKDNNCDGQVDEGCQATGAGTPQGQQATTAEGFAHKATGGKGGKTYVVTSLQDTLQRGSLRYAIEKLQGPLLIIFDKKVFTKGTVLSLDKPLRITQSNISIRGEGTFVRLARMHKWSEATPYLVPGKKNTYQCHLKTGISPGILYIYNARNIIISGITFEQIIPGNHGLGSNAYYDAECFGDQVSIFSRDSTNQSGFFNQIWIHNNTFIRCRDECLSIVRGPTKERAAVSVSYNTFVDTNKVMLIGNSIDTKMHILVSFYRNTLDGFGQRGPRIQNAIVHIYNNLYKAWRIYGIGVSRMSRVMVENNCFIAGQQDTQGIFSFGESDSSVWARKNRLQNIGTTASTKYATKSFPKTTGQGGPWYYTTIMAQAVSSSFRCP